jgi:large subunit ribosomal protein L17
MHCVIRKYRAGPAVVAEARAKRAHLEQTMRGTPGLVAYYLLETEDGVASITITEDESGTRESMGRAARWVQEHLESRAEMSAPEVTRGQALISALRAAAEGAPEGGQRLAERYAQQPPTNAVRGDGTTACPPDYPVKGNADSGIYHTPDSPSYAQTIPEFCFASASAAEAAGFHAP